MEEKELLEIEAREREQAEKNIAEMIQRKKTADIWLLYRDKFNIERQKACLPATLDVPPQVLIPIYEKVLVPIPACVSPEKFNEMMGFGVNELAEWRRKGWVETLISMPHYRYSGLDYLDELIQVSPSTSVRTRQYLTMLMGGREKFDRTYYEGRMLLQGAMIPDEYRRLFGGIRGEEIYYGSSATDYLHLSAFGLTRVVNFDEIKALTEGDLNARVNVLYWLNVLLTHPFIHGLRKTTVYSSELRDRASMLYDIVQPKGEMFFTPCWLADVYENLGATIPQTMDIDEINAVRKHAMDFIDAVKSLDEEIDKAVKDKFGGGQLNPSEKDMITAKKEEFRRRWIEDVVPTFEDISKVKTAWSMTLTGSIVTSVVAVAALKDVLTVPSTMLSMLLNRERITKLVDPAAEFLSTFFECNPIHLGFYKVHRELKRIKEMSGGWLLHPVAAC